MLERWGFPEPVCLAGLFHSIYGTEGFQGLILDLSERENVAEIIGERAEQAAFFNCVMDRDSFDCLVVEHLAKRRGAGTPPRLPLRARADPTTGMTGDERWRLTPQALHDLSAVHLADYCESWRNNHLHKEVRFLRHSKGGEPGYYRLPPGGQHAYRYDAYSACATLLGGASLAECACASPSSCRALICRCQSSSRRTRLLELCLCPCLSVSVSVCALNRGRAPA